MDAGRLGNVTAALLLGDRETRVPAEVDRLALLVDGLFEELLLVGGDPASSSPGRRVAPSDGASPLSLLSDAMDAASCERVLVVPGDPPTPDVELLLALTAWPEHAAIVAVGEDGDRPIAALYRSADVVSVLRRPLAHDRGDLSELLGRIEVDRVTPGMLGIEAKDQRGSAPDLAARAPRAALPEGS